MSRQVNTLSLIKRLQLYLQNNRLPGVKSQLEFTKNFNGNPEKYLIPTDDAIIAGTLCLLFPNHDGGLSFVLIERTSTVPDDPHSGQISFPGGRMSSEDADVQETALREAEEEVNVKRSDVRVLGKLTDLFISVSNYIVSPYVGYIDYIPDFSPQESEVNKIIIPTLSSLLDPSSIRFKDIEVRSEIFKNIQYFNLENRVIWGATAMMLNEFKSVIIDLSVSR